MTQQQGHWLAWAVAVMVIAGLLAVLVELNNHSTQRVGTALRNRVDNELALESSPNGRITAAAPPQTSLFEVFMWTGVAFVMMVATVAVAESFLAGIILEDKGRAPLAPPHRPLPAGHHQTWSDAQIESFRSQAGGH